MNSIRADVVKTWIFRSLTVFVVYISARHLSSVEETVDAFVFIWHNLLWSIVAVIAAGILLIWLWQSPAGHELISRLMHSPLDSSRRFLAWIRLERTSALVVMGLLAWTGNQAFKAAQNARWYYERNLSRNMGRERLARAEIDFAVRDLDSSLRRFRLLSDQFPLSETAQSADKRATDILKQLRVKETLVKAAENERRTVGLNPMTTFYLLEALRIDPWDTQLRGRVRDDRVAYAGLMRDTKDAARKCFQHTEVDPRLLGRSIVALGFLRMGDFLPGGANASEAFSKFCDALEGWSDVDVEQHMARVWKLDAQDQLVAATEPEALHEKEQLLLEKLVERAKRNRCEMFTDPGPEFVLGFERPGGSFVIESIRGTSTHILPVSPAAAVCKFENKF